MSDEMLIELATRCEKATGPDRELDFAIWAMRYPRDYQTTLSRIRAMMPKGSTAEQIEARLKEGKARSYTASLDAAMTLVPDGWRVSIEDATFQKAAWLHPENGQNDGRICSSCDRAKTAVLALCAASLRARSRAGTQTK